MYSFAGSVLSLYEEARAAVAAYTDLARQLGVDDETLKV
jgi:hypothetical protein